MLYYSIAYLRLHFHGLGLVLESATFLLRLILVLAELDLCNHLKNLVALLSKVEKISAGPVFICSIQTLFH